MAAWYTKNYPNMGWDRAAFLNGSGLTSENRVSAHSFTNFLHAIQKDKFNGRHYWSLLPMAGRGAWLRSRLNRPDLIYRVWTKTGSLDYVNNLTGYLITKSGKKVAFSIFINDKEKRRQVDGPNSEETEQLRREAVRWAKMAKKVQDDLLEYWVQNY
jgi:D-alanyl-D-alanine carboxypeptidase/D-alanyl-D-alanine-endopeptidase (penicillin-binding protein 4)